MDQRGQESAEEVLARLERYVEARRDRPRVFTSVDRRVPTSAPETDVAARPVPLDTLIPSREETPRRRRRFASEVAPALTAVAICSFIIVLSEWFDSVITVSVGAALMLVGVVALVRRVPLARAYTFGLVVGALLIRFS